MRLGSALVALVTLSAFAAGCIAGPAAESTDPVAAAPAGGAEPSLSFSGTGCRQGGGHSVHPSRFNPLPEPWKPADVLDDVGTQLAYSEIPHPDQPVPQKGGTIGNYHATMLCDSWLVNGEERKDLLFGFVGMKVEKPDFSDDAPTHHYVVTVIATNDEDVHAALAAMGFGPMLATGEWVEHPGGLQRIRMFTDKNGEYDSLYVPNRFGENTATHVRLWFQMPADGHAQDHAHDDGPVADAEVMPIALDLLTTGGDHFTALEQGYFSHSGTDHHEPLPGAYGKTAALEYRGFDRVFQLGPRPNVTIDGAYVH